MATNPPVGARIGRPNKWPWLETDIGGTFVITAATPYSLKTTLSRTRRLYKRDFRVFRRLGHDKKTGTGRYLIRRVA